MPLKLQLEFYLQVEHSTILWLVSIVWPIALPCHGRGQGFKSPTGRQVLESWQSGRMQEFAKFQVAEMLPIGSNPILSARNY